MTKDGEDAPYKASMSEVTASSAIWVSDRQRAST
jgi:hypothetical protein